jgi:hypothetical protein
MLWTTVFTLGVLVGVLVLAVEGVHVLAFWNLLPVVSTCAIASLAIRTTALSSRRILTALAAFCLAVLTSAGLLHLAWQFDWGRTATGSSTSGLIFIFAPLLELAIGAVAALLTVGVIVGRRFGNYWSAHWERHD